MPDPNQGIQTERSFETGKDETFANASQVGAESHNENQRLQFANLKRTYDLHQTTDLHAIENAQQIFQQAALSLQGQLAQLNSATIQHIQNAITVSHQANTNAVETANMTAKQAVKHADVAADAMWNPIQQGTADVITSAGYTPNRAVDTATAGVAATVPATTWAGLVDVIAALNGSVMAVQAAAASLANVLAQSQPKVEPKA